MRLTQELIVTASLFKTTSFALRREKSRSFEGVLTLCGACSSRDPTSVVDRKSDPVTT